MRILKQERKEYCLEINDLVAFAAQMLGVVSSRNHRTEFSWPASCNSIRAKGEPMNISTQKSILSTAWITAGFAALLCSLVPAAAQAGAKAGTQHVRLRGVVASSCALAVQGAPRWDAQTEAIQIDVNKRCSMGSQASLQAEVMDASGAKRSLAMIAGKNQGRVRGQQAAEASRVVWDTAQDTEALLAAAVKTQAAGKKAAMAQSIASPTVVLTLSAP